MKYRCMCLVIHAEGDLRLTEQDAGEPGPGQALVKVALGAVSGLPPMILPVFSLSTEVSNSDLP